MTDPMPAVATCDERVCPVQVGSVARLCRQGQEVAHAEGIRPEVPAHREVWIGGDRVSWGGAWGWRQGAVTMTDTVRWEVEDGRRASTGFWQMCPTFHLLLLSA